MEASIGLRKGAWCREEDDLLKACVQRYGEGKWHLVPIRAGLNRCRKSCRLRWLNYLKPNIKRGEFSEDEVDLMIRMHRLLGNRWSLIAGRIPGRTANDVKNYWNTKVVRTKKQSSYYASFQKEDTNNNITAKPNETTTATTNTTTAVTAMKPTHEVIKPQPRTFSRTSTLRTDSTSHHHHQQEEEGFECHENNTVAGAKQKQVSTSVDACAVVASSSTSNKSHCVGNDYYYNNNVWWGTTVLLEDKKGGNLENDTCCFDDDEQDWERFFTDPTSWNNEVIQGGDDYDGDLIIESQSWGCDDLLDANLWDS